MSGLLLLQSAAAEAVERHRTHPANYVRQDRGSVVRIAGIETLDPRAISDYETRLDLYGEDADALRVGLGQRGVTFLAILPKVAWQNIAQESNLYRFNPDPDGAVPVSTAILDTVGERSMEMLGRRSLATLVAGAGVSGIAGFLLGTTMLSAGFALIPGTLALIAGGYVAGKIAQARYCKDELPNPDALARLETELIRKAFAGPADTFFRQLWPKEGVTDPKLTLRVRLPPAPFDAQANLATAYAAGYQLTLYAVDEAVSFELDPAEAFIAHRSKRWKEASKAWQKKLAEERAEREARRAEAQARAAARRLNDPIVVVEHESAVAIIVQYGDYPIEQAVVERVLASTKIV